VQGWVIMYAVAHFVFGFGIGTQILLWCDCQMDDSKQSGIDKRRCSLQSLAQTTAALIGALTTQWD